MKNFLLTLIIVALYALQGLGQSVPQGMRYQAVARDGAGGTLDNQIVSLQMSLRAGEKGDILYTERHDVSTNQLGLFSITIGEGKPMFGEFAIIPWNLANIWLDIDMNEAGGKIYTNISSSQLLTVPYAFHAGTAGSYAGMDDPNQKNGLQFYWSTTGNLSTIPGPHYLGTRDCKDLIFKTNSINRMSITCTGIVDIGGNLFVGGTFSAAGITTFTNTTQSTNINNGAVIIDGGLGVEKNVNIGGTLCADGVTILKNTTQSTDKDNGSLVVEGGVGIEKNINIGGNSGVIGNSNVGGSFDVNGIARFNNITESTNMDNGSVIIEGGVGIEKNANIGGNTEIDGTLGVDGVTTLKNTTESNTKDNGSLVVEGGVGIEKNVNIGGNTEIDGTLGVDGITTLKNTTESTTKDNGSLVVEGGVGIENNTNIGGNTEIDGTLGVDGVTTLKNTTESNTKDNGSLVVEGGVGIEKNLNVGGNTEVDGTLGVDGVTTLKNTTQSTTKDNGSLVVEGGVGIEKNLNVGGNSEVDGTLGVDGVTTVRNNLFVTKDDGSFVATITNTNTGNGDGLKIKLGKIHPAWNGSAYLSTLPPSDLYFANQKNTVRNWIMTHPNLSGTNIIDLTPNAQYAGTACTMVNLAIDVVNTNFIGKTLTIPAVPNIFGGNSAIKDAICFIWPPDPLDVLPDCPAGDLMIPAISVPSFPIPNFLPSIPHISCNGLPMLTLPTLTFTNIAADRLNSENEFISFVDKDDRSLGSIKAQGVGDWAANLLDETYLLGIMAEIVGADLLQGLAQVVYQYAEIAKSYNEIGVEYSSGNADYAEWLERSNPQEAIHAGDIVGVRGGKVSKNLEGAEQILAVSHNPIILGNMPSKDKEPFGNKIAFTGQVPVKVVGPVHMGDYIIAKGDISGYGVAVNPKNITVEDLKLTVGRSWEENLNVGPKMVNTLIGVDNGDYINIMKDNRDKISNLESRMKDLEEKLALLLENKK